jgi:hypothetical protein
MQARLVPDSIITPWCPRPLLIEEKLEAKPQPKTAVCDQNNDCWSGRAPKNLL